MAFPRQEYWNGLPFPSPGDLPDPRINPHLLHWQADSLTLNHQGSTAYKCYSISLVTQLCPTLCNCMDCSTPASLSITSSQSLLKLVSIQLVIPSNHLIFYRPLLLLPSIFPSIRVFANESVLDIRWPKYWSFSFSPSNKYSGLISLRMDRLDLLAVQGTLKIFSNTTVQKHQFFLYSPTLTSYMTTVKTIALTRRTFVGKSYGKQAKKKKKKTVPTKSQNWLFPATDSGG